MFQTNFVFSDTEIKKLGISRKYTFKDISKEKLYHDIQKFLMDKASTLGLEARIYFDLIWNDRYKSNGSNLFDTNPKRSR